MPKSHEDLMVGPSDRQADWERALHGGDDALLFELATKDMPGQALFQIATYINGMYTILDPKGFLIHFQAGRTNEITGTVGRVAAVRDLIRDRLDWRQQREIDLGMMRWIRRSSALTPVLGAGVTMGAGGPSWPALVRALLVEAIEKGRPIFSEWKRKQTGTSLEVRREVIDNRCLTGLKAERAKEIIALIDEKKANAELLQEGALLCETLYEKELFQPITRIIYEAVPGPSDTHRALAELSSYQYVSDRSGSFPGWERIITYNFDALMSEALSEVGMPHAAWAMRRGEYVGDPDKRAQQGEPHIDVWHLHGYTPRRFFNIGAVDFVFSAAQYEEIYRRDKKGLIGDAFDFCLASPRRVALYIGCSFTDEVMNRLLERAQAAFIGRIHYAFLKLPASLREAKIDSITLQDANRRYLELGVQPVWFEDYSEIPGMIRSLK